MRNRKREYPTVHIPVVYVAAAWEDQVRRLPSEKLRRRWRRLLAEVRKARELDAD